MNRILQSSDNEVRPLSFNEAAQLMAASIANLVISKQHDYGHGNILAFGEQGILVRLNDKVARLRNLVWDISGTPNEEALDDTYMDIAGYAIIALMLREGWFELELE